MQILLGRELIMGLDQFIKEEWSPPSSEGSRDYNCGRMSSSQDVTVTVQSRLPNLAPEKEDLCSVSLQKVGGKMLLQ